MQEKRFYIGKPPAGTSTSVVNRPNNVVIKELLFCNTDDNVAADITVSVEGDDASFYSVINRKTIASNGTVIVPLSMPLPANKSLTVRAYTDGAINVVVSGVEM